MGLVWSLAVLFCLCIAFEIYILQCSNWTKLDFLRTLYMQKIYISIIIFKLR